MVVRVRVFVRSAIVVDDSFARVFRVQYYTVSEDSTGDRSASFLVAVVLGNFS